MKVILTKEKDLQVPIMLESQAVANRILDSVYPYHLWRLNDD